MKGILLILILLISAGLLSCLRRQETNIMPVKMINPSNALYIDSMVFRHYQRPSRPWLLSTRTFAFNDSMSEVLDSMNIDTLVKMNSSDRSYREPLSHKLTGDTLIVDLIYTPNHKRFPFGEIKSKDDSIYLNLSGDVFKELPGINKKYYVKHRYFRSVFKILIDYQKV